jgi:hypothetical protein
MQALIMVKGTVLRREAASKLSAVTKLGYHWSTCRKTLWEKTVAMARMEPLAVLMEAATIPIRHQPPKKSGAWCVKSLIKASSSGSHRPQVGKSMMELHVSVSNAL